MRMQLGIRFGVECFQFYGKLLERKVQEIVRDLLWNYENIVMQFHIF